MKSSAFPTSAAPSETGSVAMRGVPSVRARTVRVLLTIGLVASLGAATAAESAATAARPGYTLVDLGTLGGDFSEAREINAQGTVVGVSRTGSGGFHAFVGDAHGLRDLGAVDFGSLRIFINDRGQVAWSTDAAGGVSAGSYFWDPQAGCQRLGSGRVADINDRGQVAGTDAGQAFVWDPVTGRQALSAPPDGTSSAAEINDQGQVAGTDMLSDGTTRAVRWDARGHRTVLGPVTATAINSRGQVAGEVGPCGPAFDECGFLWTPRQGRTEFAVSPPEGVTGFSFTVADLNDHGLVVGTGLDAYAWDIRRGLRHLETNGALSTDAVAVNNRGLVVGRWQDSATDTDKAAVWSDDGDLTDLGPFPPDGPPISLATDLNARGVVAGVAADATGELHATVWVPGRP